MFNYKKKIIKKFFKNTKTKKKVLYDKKNEFYTFIVRQKKSKIGLYIYIDIEIVVSGSMKIWDIAIYPINYYQI